MERAEKKRRIAIIVLSSFILILIIIYMIFNKNINKPRDVKIKEYEKVAIVKEEPSVEKINLIGLIIEKYKELGYMTSEKLSTFEVTDIVEYGYYKSKPEIKYLQVNFKYTCQDNTDSCISYKNTFDNNDQNYIKGSVLIVLENGQFIKFQKEEKHTPNSGFIETLDIIK